MTFKLNMTDKEAASKDFELPPSGSYVCRITDIELDEVKKQGDNFGKPFWKLTLVVEDGAYAGTTIFTTVMLFQGALYGLKRLCEAVHPEYIQDNDIHLPSTESGMPSPDPWLGQIVHIKGVKHPAGSQRKGSGDIREYDEFQVTFKKPKEGASSKTTSGGLPMPS